MKILGIVGWDDGTHDPAAALVVDGQLISFIEEERLCRRKHAISELPHLSVQAVLACAGEQIENIDVVAYGYDMPYYNKLRKLPWHLTDAEFLKKVLGVPMRRLPKFVWVPHHHAHAASAYYASGLGDATVLVVDGLGEEHSISLYSGHQSRLEFIRSWPSSHSLGTLYEAASVHCGFTYLDGGKTMGLAAYGQGARDSLPLRWESDDLLSPISDRLLDVEVRRAWLEIMQQGYGPPPIPPRTFDRKLSRTRLALDDPKQLHPDVAAAAQDVVEKAMTSLVRYGIATTGIRNVCIAGGVALNCAANGKLVDLCDSLFIQPASHDAGAAAGAAMKVAADNGVIVQPMTMTRVDLGPSYPSSLVGEILGACHLGATQVDDPAEEAVRLLLRGRVIGWFQGRMEVGPRALGHRSILALPKPIENKDRVNAIKGREPWRPLAPSLLRSEMPMMFERDVDSPFMLLSFPLSTKGRLEAPAIAHVDGSARPQTVPPGSGPFQRLLDLLRERSGLGAVINTSFNGPGEPIVCTPADAVRTFMTTGLDALVIEDFVLEKRVH